MRENFKFSASIALLAVAYMVTAKLGLLLAFQHASATAVWPPSGIALSALLLFGPRLWPGIFLGAFLANLQNNLSILHANPIVSLASAAGIAVGNTLEPLVGAYLVLRFADGKNAFNRSYNTVKFSVLAAAVSPILSATGGVLSLTLCGLAPWRELGPIWLTWWMGDASGILIFAPFLIVWLTPSHYSRLLSKRWEALLLVLSMLTVSQLLFNDRLLHEFDQFSPFVLTFPIFMWSAFRFGQAGATLSVICFSAAAVWNTARGVGPFAVQNPNTSMLLVQIFMGITSLSTLIVASVVAQRKKAENDLMMTNEVLNSRVYELVKEIVQRRRMERELREFSYIASHDLQEPLRMVASYAQLVEMRYKDRLDAEGVKFIDRMVSGVKRMKDLISSLQDYSHLDSPHVTFKPTDCGAAYKAALENLEISIKEKNAQVSADPLPVVEGDFIQLCQLFQNLIGNSIKFNDKEKPFVKISVKKMDNEFVFSITDNGIGFDPKYKDTVFSIFRQLHPREQYEGTGIGLTICKKIVERHGGRIWAESVPGEGSSFHFTLPRTGRIYEKRKI